MRINNTFVIIFLLISCSHLSYICHSLCPSLSLSLSQALSSATTVSPYCLSLDFSLSLCLSFTPFLSSHHFSLRTITTCHETIYYDIMRSSFHCVSCLHIVPFKLRLLSCQLTYYKNLSVRRSLYLVNIVIFKLGRVG